MLINALIQGAGGDIISDNEAGKDAKIDIDSDAGRDAATVIQKLAGSKAAQPDLTTSNEGTSLGQMFGGPGEFMTNWTFVYQNYEGLVDSRRPHRRRTSPTWDGLATRRRSRARSRSRPSGESTSGSAPSPSIPTSRSRPPPA